MKKVFLGLLFISIVLNAGSSITAGYIADEYKGSHLGKVVVRFLDISLAMEHYVEQGFVETLNSYDNVKATAFLDKVSPIYKLSSEKVNKKLVKDGFEKLILISKPKDNRDNLVAPTEWVNFSYTMADTVFRVEILDLKNSNKLVWVGDIYIHGDSDLKDTRNHLTRHMIKLLDRDGLVN